MRLVVILSCLEINEFANVSACTTEQKKSMIGFR